MHHVVLCCLCWSVATGENFSVQERRMPADLSCATAARIFYGSRFGASSLCCVNCIPPYAKFNNGETMANHADLGDMYAMDGDRCNGCEGYSGAVTVR